MSKTKIGYGAGLLVAVGMTVALVYVLSRPERSLEFYEGFVGNFSGYKNWAPVIFVPLYILGSLLLMPVTVLNLTAGVLFGAAQGALLASLSALASASIAFLLGKKFASLWFRQKFDRRDLYQKLERAVDREGWKIVLLVRFTPFFPFSPVNFFLGASRISLADFVRATWIGMLPSVLVHSYLGSLAKNITELSLLNREVSGLEWGLSALSVLGMLVLLIYFAFRAKEALRKRLDG